MYKSVTILEEENHPFFDEFFGPSSVRLGGVTDAQVIAAFFVPEFKNLEFVGCNEMKDRVMNDIKAKLPPIAIVCFLLI